MNQAEMDEGPDGTLVRFSTQCANPLSLLAPQWACCAATRWIVNSVHALVWDHDADMPVRSGGPGAAARTFPPRPTITDIVKRKQPSAKAGKRGRSAAAQPALSAFEKALLRRGQRRSADAARTAAVIERRLRSFVSATYAAERNSATVRALSMSSRSFGAGSRVR